MSAPDLRAAASTWDVLLDDECFLLRRRGRFLVLDLHRAHDVISTSVLNGGSAAAIRALVNHQSCEGAGHLARHALMTGANATPYHDRVCEDAETPPSATAVMGTAANMNYAAVVRAVDDDVAVVAVVTAGVEGNATAAGEPAAWRETADGIVHAPPKYAGTINTMLHVSHPLTPPALARAIVTMTEGKSAALQRLAVPSKRGTDLATGTGTDQFCIAAPANGRHRLTSASPHLKLGELIGQAARDATIEALRWQNGLEASYTRGLFHALGRYGVTEAALLKRVKDLLTESDLALLNRNLKAASFEPLVGAAAHALATTCDRVRHGTIPSGVAADAMAQQAACLAASLAAQAPRWPEFHARLRPHAAAGDVAALVAHAVALGWSEKWRLA